MFYGKTLLQMKHSARLRVNLCLKPNQRQAAGSGVNVLKRCVETRVGVVSGGGARWPPFSVPSAVFLARPAASFWPLDQQV